MELSITDATVGPLTFDALVAGDPDAATHGRLIVLLHGFPETAESYRAMLPALAEAGYFAVAPTQRGYSPRARPVPVEAYGIVSLVNDVLAIAAVLHAPTFHVVGHDWGGAVAWVAAALHPDVVSTLTALSTPHPDALSDAIADPQNPQHQASAYMNTFRAEGSEDRMLADGAASFKAIFGASGLPAAQLDAYAQVLATPEALGAALNWYRANPLPVPVRVGPIKVPTLYIFGTGDGAFTKATAEASAALVDAPYTYLEEEGHSHWLPEELPAEIDAALLAHLKSVSSE
jgi:pimeloyl-ACP methyl ester carboxylesterase